MALKCWYESRKRGVEIKVPSSINMAINVAVIDFPIEPMCHESFGRIDSSSPNCLTPATAMACWLFRFAAIPMPGNRRVRFSFATSFSMSSCNKPIYLDMAVLVGPKTEPGSQRALPLALLSLAKTAPEKTELLPRVWPLRSAGVLVWRRLIPVYSFALLSRRRWFWVFACPWTNLARMDRPLSLFSVRADRAWFFTSIATAT